MPRHIHALTYCTYLSCAVKKTLGVCKVAGFLFFNYQFKFNLLNKTIRLINL